VIKKILLTSAAIFILSAVSFIYSPDARAFFPNIFEGYIEGREAARSLNYRDAMYAAQYRRAMIDNYHRAYNNTGNFDYLCVAWAMGSEDARVVLFKNDMRCKSEVVTVVD
jgi:hypothetical protein